MKNKKIIGILIIALIIVLILFFTILGFLHYKKVETGNNISDKNLKQIEDYILNISSYDAEIEVKVEGDKTTNKYLMNQKYCKPNIASQSVIEPKNIEGLTVKYDGVNMEISNSKLGLSTIYENYEYIADNVLWLSDFIECYKQNNGTINENNGIIIMEVKDNNRVNSCRKLYIDREANKITKLVIEDENKKNSVYIIYNKIEIGGLSKDSILAFKTKVIGKQNV